MIDLTVDSSVVRKLAVTLMRGAEGFGFSVSGFNPISVTRVQPGQCQGEAPGGGNRPNQVLLASHQSILLLMVSICLCVYTHICYDGIGCACGCVYHHLILPS